MPITDLVGGHTIGNSGVFIDTSRFVYGNGSGRFVAANSTYLTVPANTDTTLNPYYIGNAPTSNAMTYEFWFYPSSTTQNCILFGVYSPNSQNDGVGGYVNLTLTNLTVTLTSFAAGAFTQTTAGTAINGWNHVAISWPSTGGVVLYLNGVQVGGLAFLTYHFFGQPVWIGCNYGATSFFDGWIDDLRFTPSQRYSANFTPGYSPAAPQWVTANATNLATGSEGGLINATISATAIDPIANGILRYTVKSNPYSIPLTITNSGSVTGTLPAIGAPMSLTLDAVDTNGNYSADRVFLFQSSIFSIPELKYSWRFDAANTSVFYSPNLGSGTVTLNSGTATYTAAPAPHAANNALLLTNSATMTMPASTNFEFLTTKNWTLEFWADLDASTPAANNTILSLGQTTGNQGREFRVYQDTANSYSFGSTTALGSNAAILGFNQPTAGWNHFAVVRTGNSISTFTNGALSNTISNAATLGTTLYDNGTFTFNGLTGNANTSFNSLYLRGVNLFSLSKYSDPFTPVWNDYLQPVWESNAGAVFSGWEGNAITNVSLSAESFYSNPFTYSLTNSTSLPNGVVLTNNVVSGTVPAFSYSGAQFFTLLATEANGVTSPRSFFVNSVSTAPVWGNAALSPIISNTTISPLTLSTSDPRGLPVTYALQNGSSLPGGLSLSNTGVISGTATQTTSDQTVTFTVNAINSAGKYNTQQLSLLEYCTADANYANTALLLHADGSFADSSAANTTVSVVGANATISTANFKWGNSSIFINNVSNSATPAGYITAPFTGITGDWTVEMWVNLPALRAVAGNPTEYLFTYTNGINSTNSFANSIFTCFLGSSSVANGIQYFGCRSYAAGSNTQNGSDIGSNNIVGLLTTGAWHNVAITRQGTNVYLFWDGVLVNSGTIPAFTNIAGSFYFGVGGNATAQLPFYGYMDDIRVTKKALYTANYTVQPYAYGSIAQPTPTFSSANTNLVLDVNSAVSYQLSASSIGAGTITYSLASGSFPPGLSISNSGLISGTTGIITGNAVTYTANVAATLEGFTSVTPVTYTVQPGDPLFGSVINMISPLPGYPTSVLPADVFGHTVTAQGSGGLVSSAQSKWGAYGRNAIATSNNGNFLFDAHSTTMAGDFTVELWAYASSFPNSINILWSAYNGGGLPNINWMVTSGGAVMLNWGSGGVVDIVSANGVFPVGQWNHVAWCRQSGTSNVFVNGTLALTGTNVTGTIGSTTSTWGLGGYQGSPTNYSWQGYLTEMRVTNGIARYTANFTAPTLPFPQTVGDTPVWSTANTNLVLDAAEVEVLQLTAPSPGGSVTYSIANGSLPTGLALASNGLITGTTQGLVQGANAVSYNAVVNASYSPLWQANANVAYVVQPGDLYFSNVATLLHGDGSTKDSSNSGLTWTTQTGGSISNTVSKFGTGSLAFSGAGTIGAAGFNSSAPALTKYQLQSGQDFTLEGWINMTSETGNLAQLWTYGATGQSTNNSTGFIVFTYNSTAGATPNRLVIQTFGPSGSPLTQNQSSAGISMSFGQWNHFAICRTGGVFSFYQNGVLMTASSDFGNGGSTNVASSSFEFFLGTGVNNGTGQFVPFVGFMDDVRFTIGTARYSGNFSVPTQPFPNAADQTPVWSIANTNLVLDSSSNTTSTFTLLAPPPNGQTPAFSVANGALPSGMTLNANGLVNGTTQYVAQGANVVTYNATITANYQGLTSNSNVSYMVQPDDLYFANVVTLIHAEDAANGTTLTDSSGKQTFTLNSGGSVSTANKQFGQSSLYFPGAVSATNIVHTAVNPAGVAFGTNDFTVEAWVYPITLSQNTSGGQWRACVASYKGTGTSTADWVWSLELISTTSATTITSLAFEAFTSAQGNVSQSSIPVSLTMNQWYHVAASRKNGVLYLSINGVQGADNGSPKLGAQNIYTNTSAYLTIGGLLGYTQFNGQFNGYIDEVRITNGTGRYGPGNFTPSTLSFPNKVDATPQWSSANTNIVLDSYANAAYTLVAPSTGGSTSFAVANGSLPTGLALASNGLVSGVTQGLAQGVNAVVSNATITAAVPGVSANTNVTYVVQPDDLYFTNVVLLAHFDDATTATTFVDTSGHQTLTAVANANTSTAHYQFGGSSLSLNGSTQYVSLSNTAAMTFGTNNFTIETWFYMTAINNNPAIIDTRPTSTNGFYPSIYIANSGQPTWLVNGVTPMTGPALTTNAWNHIAVSKAGGQARMFVNGLQVNSVADTNTYVAPTAGHMTIGAASIFASPLANFQGYMDEFRITNGVGRYTANFTVQQYSFPNSQDRSQILFTAPIAPATTSTFANTISAYSNATVSTAFASNYGTNYSVSAGSVPTGLTLNSNGVLNGVTSTVTNATAYNFTVLANNPGGFSNTIAMTYNVAPVDSFAANTTVQLRASQGFVDMTGNFAIANGTLATITTPTLALPTDAKSTFNIAGATGNQNGYIRTGNMPSGMALGTRNYTLEMWANITMTSDTAENGGNPLWVSNLFSLSVPGSTPNGSLALEIALYSTVSATQPNSFIWRGYPQGSSSIINNASGAITAFNCNQWNHYAFVRNGNSNVFYVNGIAISTVSFTPTAFQYQSTLQWYFGLIPFVSGSANFGQPFNGQMDDIRITMDVARYTSNFTPPGALGR